MFSSKKVLLIIFAGVLIFGLFGNSLVSQVTSPKDSQIVEILLAINNSEITEGRLAKSSANKDVRKFAEELVEGHLNSNAELTRLTESLELEIESGSIGESLRLDSLNEISSLKKLSGQDFDRSYLDDQVKDHTDVLKLLDSVLISSAQDPQLKQLLKRTRALVFTHLESAKKNQSKLLE